jgi:hypothetical protein
MDRIQQLRHSLAHGKAATQSQLDLVTAELSRDKDSIRPKDKVEPLPLYEDTGKRLGTQAPRWLCHALALRHRCAHILLLWHSPTMGDALVLQIRNWDKDDSPGCVDISVGGHMTATDSSAEEAALSERVQETGLKIQDLEGSLEYVGGYSFDEERPGEYFFNSEWRDVYIAYVKQDSLSSIRFPDGEVAGIVLVPLKDAGKFLAQQIVPMASALTNSLPKCLEHSR